MLKWEEINIFMEISGGQYFLVYTQLLSDENSLNMTSDLCILLSQPIQGQVTNTVKLTVNHE
jgi:hypothetical protein